MTHTISIPIEFRLSWWRSLALGVASRLVYPVGLVSIRAAQALASWTVDLVLSGMTFRVLSGEKR